MTASDQAVTLTNLSRVVSLSPDEAAKGLPVKVSGTVTYYDRERGIVFLQDGSDAVSARITPAKENEAEVQPGQLLEVEGVTARGRLKSSIRGKTRRILGQGQLPTPMQLTPERLLTENAESRLVQVTGWIPAISSISGRLNFTVVLAPGKSLDVVLNASDSPETRDLAGSLVDVTGVFTPSIDAAGQTTGGRIRLNNPNAIRRWKSLPITPVSGAGVSADNRVAREPFRIRGTVINHSLGEFLIVRDGSGSLKVPYRGLNYFNQGSLVEIFAYPDQQRHGMVLTNISVKVMPTDSANEEVAGAISTPNSPNPNLAALTRVMQIRRLTPQEASRGYPLDITGVVTFSDPLGYLYFVQDETSGIYFDLSRVDNPPPLSSGQKIQIKGFSGPGDYAPIIIGQAIRVLGRESFPAPESVSFRKLMGGTFDSQWVSLKGVVRKQWVGTNASTIALFAGDGVIKVNVRGLPPEAQHNNLVDAAVEIQGVCQTIFDERRRLQSVELQVPDWKQVTVREARPDDPFKSAVKAVNDLFQFHAGIELHRARLMGVVTLRSPDGSFYLQDGSGGIQIQPGQSLPPLPVGTVVDVVGFPVIADKLAMLQEALVREVSNNSIVEAAELKADSRLEDGLQGTLVRIHGQLLGHFPHGLEELLTVQFGRRTIDVILEKELQPGQLASCEPGAVVSMTGVFLGQPDATGNLQSFRLLLRSEADITVNSRPSWWTAQRTLWAAIGMSGVLLLALGWVRVLRRQVQQRTRELHEEIEHHKSTEAKLELEIAERKRMELEVVNSHQELLVASRQAGMAEVATSVLHNVGNVLNSVNVSAGLVADKIRKSKVSNIARAAEMIKEHSHNLAQFLQDDPKGRQLPQYLDRLAGFLTTEQTGILAELDSLRKNVEHIKGIVGMQQNYAKAFGAAEPVRPTELVEDALRMNSGALIRHEVRVVREYEPDLPEITVDKHKLLQILVNLICNAKKACDDSIALEKVLTVKVAHGEGRLKISVIDNGVGIPQENLTRIFNHGFTTRKDGHGFGLHSGALAAKEMGGALLAQSEGPGKGAQFIIELPAK
jgi:signal transduction histidine kinase